MSDITTFIEDCIGGPCLCNWAKIGTKTMIIGKVEMLSSLTNEMIICVKNLK